MKKEPFALLSTKEGDEKLPVKVSPFADNKDGGFEEGDLIIVTVKASMTEEVLSKAKAMGLIGKKTILVTCQGGLENEDIMAKYTTVPEHVVVGCTSSFGKSKGPMAIENFGIRATTLWMHNVPSDGKADDTVVDVMEKANKAGINFTLTPQAIAEKWTMLLYYTANIAVSAIVGRSFGTSWENCSGKELLTQLAIECALVAEKEGIDTKLFNKEIAIGAVQKLATVSASHGGSMHADLGNKRITEIDATSGALLRKAEKNGLKLPHTNSVYLLLRLMEQTYDLQI
jgi:2-dehydropantoate 2-reductase